MTYEEYQDATNRGQVRFVLRRMAAGDPLKPSRADYRLIRKLIDSSFGSKVLHTEKAYTRVVRVFAKAGGSWERLFLGSSKDIGLIKKILRVAFKKGFLTKAPQWR